MAYPRRPDSTCEHCGETFHAHNARQRYCSKSCFDEYRRVTIAARTEKQCTGCGETRPLDMFARASRRADGRQAQCKACGVIARRTTQRNTDLKRKFNITAAEFDAMLAQQGGACLICGAVAQAGRFLHVDHDHSCCPGQTSCGRCVRGILCRGCNTGIGMLGDDPDRLLAAAAYLIRASAQVPIG